MRNPHLFHFWCTLLVHLTTQVFGIYGVNNCIEFLCQVSFCYWQVTKVLTCEKDRKKLFWLLGVGFLLMEERRHHNWAYFRIWSFWVCAACALTNPQSTEICFALDIDVLAATKKILKIHSVFVVMRCSLRRRRRVWFWIG